MKTLRDSLRYIITFYADFDNGKRDKYTYICDKDKSPKIEDVADNILHRFYSLGYFTADISENEKTLTKTRSSYPVSSIKAIHYVISHDPEAIPSDF